MRHMDLHLLYTCVAVIIPTKPNGSFLGCENEAAMVEEAEEALV